MFREAIENCKTYTETNNLLSRKTLIAPAYFLLIGAESHEAAIITRDRNNFKINTILDENSELEANIERLCLYQTNVDLDLKSDQRSHIAEQLLSEKLDSEEKFDLKWLRQLMRTDPIKNEQTFSSFTICPKLNLFESCLIWKILYKIKLK